MRHFINADQPANPTVHTNAHLNGLTKREHFAAMAIQGNIKAFQDCDVTDYHDMAQDCVMFADALLKALENDK